MRTYTLDFHDPVPEPDLVKWIIWRETADVTVALTDNGIFTVSTVFLGLDHARRGSSHPLVFETMVFSNEEFVAEVKKRDPNFSLGGDSMRYSTWADADAGHWKMVAKWIAKIDAVGGEAGRVIASLRLDA